MILQRMILGMFLLVAGAGVICAQQLNMGDVLPLDTAVRIGKLDNGMAYYLRHNAKSAGLVDFYIVYDVGAVQEAVENGEISESRYFSYVSMFEEGVEKYRK